MIHRQCHNFREKLFFFKKYLPNFATISTHMQHQLCVCLIETEIIKIGKKLVQEINYNDDINKNDKKNQIFLMIKNVYSFFNVLCMEAIDG